MVNILSKIFGTKHSRDLKAMQPLVKAINDLEPAMKAMTDEQLAGQTAIFRQKLADGATLDDILVPAFATVREASFRALKMRHFDVQLVGGIALHRGKIAEMGTGEGKTLVATLAVYLNALKGEGVHVITVNDYLAKRDAAWMGKVYNALGMSVGAVVHGLDQPQRKAAYASDITYGTNNEFGFDYLRDNMKFLAGDRVQRGHAYAIVDEVDSILIDEARTPLIISGPSEEATDKYYKINHIIPFLQRGEKTEHGEPGDYTTTGDYTVDEKNKTAELTEEGLVKVEKLLGITNMYDPVNMDLNSHVQTALKAHALFQRDHDYVVKDDQVIIVDEFTGRLMPGRRWGDGLHQAMEAKEGVTVQRENQTLATITFQNYFRMYKKIAGMTGTAETEAGEFYSIYKLDVMKIPPNKKSLREDFNDAVYSTENGKFLAAAKEIQVLQAKGQPVLVGTVSVEKSEKLSALLTQMGVQHEVLNAKNHEREAEIIAQAGRKGAVTVSTNMAGRGTDIQLGGNPDFLAREYLRSENKDPDTVPKEEFDAVLKAMKEQAKKEHDEVTALGGLHVIGTARHESRRIDNQLRGRAARQGDPGSTRFYLSLEDNLVRIFGGDRLKGMMQKLGMQDDEPIESKLLSKLIESAQKGVEDRNFSSRKHLLEYDDVMNMQRKIIYTMRGALLEGEAQQDRIGSMIAGSVAAIVDQRLPGKSGSYAWDLEGLGSDLMTRFGVKIDVSSFDSMERKKVEETLNAQLAKVYQDRTDMVGAGQMRGIEQMIMLSIIDSEWKDHLLRMDDLKQGIGWRGYGQKDPLQEYKREAYDLFEGMFYAIGDESVRSLFTFQVSQPEPVASPANPFINAAAPPVKPAVTPELPAVPVPRVMPPKPGVGVTP